MINTVKTSPLSLQLLPPSFISIQIIITIILKYFPNNKNFKIQFPVTHVSNLVAHKTFKIILPYTLNQFQTKSLFHKFALQIKNIKISLHILQNLLKAIQLTCHPTMGAHSYLLGEHSARVSTHTHTLFPFFQT